MVNRTDRTWVRSGGTETDSLGVREAATPGLPGDTRGIPGASAMSDAATGLGENALTGSTSTTATGSWPADQG